MQFPSRDFTNQYISRSYQDVLQQYITGSGVYVLDGLGNLVFIVPDTGSSVLVSSQTSSMTVASSSVAVYTVSASYAVTASYALGAVFGNVDGGFPDSVYGGISPIDGGTV